MNKPEKKKSPKGHGCQCGAYTYAECGCDVSWEDNDGYNKAIEEYEAYHEAILCEKDNEIEELKKQINSTIGMNDRDIYWKDFYKRVIQEQQIARQAEEIKSLKENRYNLFEKIRHIIREEPISSSQTLRILKKINGLNI